MSVRAAWTLVPALALALSAAPPAAGQTADADAVRGVVAAVSTLTQEKNLAALDSVFAPDGWVHIIEGAGVNHGWADYRDHHLGPELAEFQRFTYRYYAIEPQVRGTIAWTPFRYELPTRRGATWSWKGGARRCWRSGRDAG